MKNIELEAKILSIVSRVCSGGFVEDSLVECKAEWPDPQKAARQIAGHSNHSAPEAILWIIGLDEKGRRVTGASDIEFSNWWSKISSYFDGLPPAIRLLSVPTQSKSVVGVLMSTDRAPYMTRNPVYGATGGGAVEWEVPWREGNSTRSARRSDLVSLLAPLVEHPDVEVRAASFAVAEANRRKSADFYSLLYMVPRSEKQTVFPFHKCSVEAVVEGLEPFSEMRPFVFMPATSDGMDGADLYRNRESSNEFTLVEPGLVRFQSSITLDELPDSWGDAAVVKIKLMAAGGRRPLVLEIPMTQPLDEHCAFVFKRPDRLRTRRSKLRQLS